MATFDSRPGFSPRPPEVVKFSPFDISKDSIPKRGKNKDENQDTLFCFDKDSPLNNSRSFGIFDGMGGLINGRGSSIRCSKLVEDELKKIPTPIYDQTAEKLLKTISLYANRQFIKEKESEKKLGGTTGTFGIIYLNENNQQRIGIVNRGDSRAYFFRPDNKGALFFQLTTDDGLLEHSFKKSDRQKEFERLKKEVDNASELGNLSENGRFFFEKRNQISNYYGNKDVKDYLPDFASIDFTKGDILLLTTDGIHDNLTTKEITTCLSKHKDSYNILCDLITSASNRSLNTNHIRAKLDDMTAIVIICK